MPARLIDHFVAAGGGGAAIRHGDVYDPNARLVQARVALGGEAVLAV
jgi:hypothetical protein